MIFINDVGWIIAVRRDDNFCGISLARERHRVRVDQRLFLKYVFRLSPWGSVLRFIDLTVDICEESQFFKSECGWSDDIVGGEGESIISHLILTVFQLTRRKQRKTILNNSLRI